LSANKSKQRKKRKREQREWTPIYATGYYKTDAVLPVAIIPVNLPENNL